MAQVRPSLHQPPCGGKQQRSPVPPHETQVLLPPHVVSCSLQMPPWQHMPPMPPQLPQVPFAHIMPFGQFVLGATHV